MLSKFYSCSNQNQTHFNKIMLNDPKNVILIGFDWILEEKYIKIEIEGILQTKHIPEAPLERVQHVQLHPTICTKPRLHPFDF